VQEPSCVALRRLAATRLCRCDAHRSRRQAIRLPLPLARRSRSGALGVACASPDRPNADCRLLDSDCDQLARALKRNTHIKTCNLRRERTFVVVVVAGSRSPANFVAALLRSSIELTGNMLTSLGVWNLCQSLERSTCLSRLILSGAVLATVAQTNARADVVDRQQRRRIRQRRRCLVDSAQSQLEIRSSGLCAADRSQSACAWFSHELFFLVLSASLVFADASINATGVSGIVRALKSRRQPLALAVDLSGSSCRRFFCFISFKTTGNPFGDEVASVVVFTLPRHHCHVITPRSGCSLNRRSAARRQQRRRPQSQRSAYSFDNNDDDDDK
jgi:hypothetical protein